jgi:hypothetical protein
MRRVVGYLEPSVSVPSELARLGAEGGKFQHIL